MKSPELTVESAANCSCQPSDKEVRLLISKVNRINCAYCGELIQPTKMKFMCFCQVKSSPPEPPWGASIEEFEPSVAIEVSYRRNLLHEKCLLKALPYIKR